MPAIDHLIWAAPDLDPGAALFAEISGVTPVRGGAHPGFGTRNSLLGLGDELYLEIMAPDPAQNLDGNRGGRIAGMARPALLTFAVHSSDLAGLAEAARIADLSLNGPFPMGRTRPDGVVLAWSILEFTGHAFGDLVPFAIDWRDTPHPAPGMAKGCSLLSFAALTPEPDALSRLYDALGIMVDVIRADAPGLLARLDTPRGELVLRSA